MFAFDIWINKHHPDLLTEFNSLRQAQKPQTFYHWAKENYPGMLVHEWPAIARLRARHLRREDQRE